VGSSGDRDVSPNDPDCVILAAERGREGTLSTYLKQIRKEEGSRGVVVVVVVVVVVLVLGVRLRRGRERGPVMSGTNV